MDTAFPKTFTTLRLYRTKSYNVQATTKRFFLFKPLDDISELIG